MMCILLSILLQIQQPSFDPDIAQEFSGSSHFSLFKGNSDIVLIVLGCLSLVAFVCFIVFVIVKLIQIDKTTQSINEKLNNQNRNIHGY